MEKNNGLYEVAVLIKESEHKYNLCYSTPITDDVIGWLTNDQVVEILNKIKDLGDKDGKDNIK